MAQMYDAQPTEVNTFPVVPCQIIFNNSSTDS